MGAKKGSPYLYNAAISGLSIESFLSQASLEILELYTECQLALWCSRFECEMNCARTETRKLVEVHHN